MAADIGVIGLGEMGRPMARALLASGFAVVVHDPYVDDLDELVAAGAVVAPDVAGLSGRCDVISVVVRGERTARSILVGDGGIASSARPGTTVLLHTTMQPAEVQALASAAAAHGVDVVDAALSGSKDRADAGELTVMLGAEPDVVERVRAVVEAFGHQIHHVGGVGAASAAKLANNILFFGTRALAYEALALARAHGVEESSLLPLIQASTGDSWVIRTWADSDRRLREQPPDHTNDDLWSAAAAARSVGIHLPVVALLAELMPGMRQARRAVLLADDATTDPPS